VVYGPAKESVAISLDPSVLERIIKTSIAGLNTLIDLGGAAEVSGRTVLVKDLQREPVYGDMVHADLYELDQTKRVRVSVPIHLTGIPVGVTMGGLLDHALRAIEVDYLARAIPAEFVIDVSALEQGQSLHVSDLVLPEGVEAHTSLELSVVSVVAPKAEEEPVVEEEALEGEEAEGEEPKSDAGEAEGDSKDS